jgi:predicted transcriptional regulator of viral defense system
MGKQPDYRQLYEIAENQAGYFSSSQAKEAGFSWERLSDNVKKGNFIRIYRAVYRLVQFPHSPYEDMFVTWLRTGPNSVISHESALYLYDLSDVLPAQMHVIMPRSGSRRRKEIRLHTHKLSENEIAHREGLPVTTASRTILDVAESGLAEEQVRQSIIDALRRGLTTKDELLIQASHRSKHAHQFILKVLDGEEK